MPNKKQTATVFVYQLKDGSFYKAHNKGTWAIMGNGINRKDITTKGIEAAQRFKKMPDTVPYCHSCMHGGRYLKVTITTMFEVSDA